MIMQKTMNAGPIRGRRNWITWAGLLSLLLGIALLDRSFAWWRNDRLLLPNANGVYPTLAEIDPAFWSQTLHAGVLKPMAASGVILIVLSVVLFGQEREAPPQSLDPSLPLSREQHHG